MRSPTQSDEFGLHQVELADGLRKDFRAMAPRAVANDGEAELVGFIVPAKVGDGIAFLQREKRLGPSAADARHYHRDTNANKGDRTDPETLHRMLQNGCA